MTRWAPRTSGAGMTAAALAVLLTSTMAFAQQAAAPPEPPKAWEGSAGLGVSLTSGNSDTVTYNVAFDLTRTPQARNVMKWSGLYLRGEQEGTAIVDRTSLGYRDEFTLSGRTFVFGQFDYLRDPFKLIDYLAAPTAGVGFKAVDTEATTFAVDAGAGGVWEKNPGREVRTSGALTASETFTHQLTSTAAIKHKTVGLWKANDLGDGLYTLSLGLATRLSERAQLSIDLLDTFKSQPPTAATKKNDTAVVMALTATF